MGFAGLVYNDMFSGGPASLRVQAFHAQGVDVKNEDIEGQDLFGLDSVFFSLFCGESMVLCLNSSDSDS